MFKTIEDNSDSIPVAQSSAPSATDILHFEKWLSLLGEKKATDLHLTVGNVPMLRINGDISPIMEEDVISGEKMQRIVEHLLSSEELARLEKDKQIILSRTLKKVMRFRMHIFYARGFFGISLRHLSEDSALLQDLPHSRALLGAISASSGLYLIAGPFDSGKTSTLRSMINEINNTQSKYIVTLEAPVEYLIPSNKSVIVQRDVGKDVKSFSEGLSCLHDEDADVIVIGYIEDADVLEKVLNLSASGRLCIAIASGNGVVSVLETLRDLVDEEDRIRVLHMLSDAILGISYQLILSKMGGGRTLVASTMIATNPIKSLIREGKFASIANIMHTSREEGMITLDKALAQAVQQGVIDLKSAQQNSSDINQFNIMLSH